MPTILVEIRAAEGGDDAKLLVREQIAIYRRLCDRRVFSIDIVDDREGTVVLEVAGKLADVCFANESGGHRWQRVSPTEKRGRVQTSTITVAVMPVVSDIKVNTTNRDFEWQATRGSGAGGQNRNKTSTAVILTHKPTGLTVRCESERSQYQNRRTAMSLLLSKLRANAVETASAGTTQQRRQQVGSGQRGDKRRTIAVQRDDVVDHITGRQWSFKDYVKGNWD